MPPISQPTAHVSDCVFAEMYSALRLLLAVAVAGAVARGTTNENVSVRVVDVVDDAGKTLLP